MKSYVIFLFKCILFLYILIISRAVKILFKAFELLQNLNAIQITNWRFCRSNFILDEITFNLNFLQTWVTKRAAFVPYIPYSNLFLLRYHLFHVFFKSVYLTPLEDTFLIIWEKSWVIYWDSPLKILYYFFLI